MKTKYLNKIDFAKLVNRFKANSRYDAKMFARFPWESDAEYKLRIEETLNPSVLPTSFTYHGKYHTIEFRLK